MTTSAGKRVPWYIWAPLVVALGVAVFDYFTALPPLIPADLVAFSGPTMGTRYTVSLALDPQSPEEPPDLAKIKLQVNNRLAEINRLMSTYDPNSELSRFNRYDGDDWFSVSPETAQVVSAALEIAARSSGAFDPTVGPVVNLWGFGPQKDLVEPPSDAAIADALENVGYQNVTVQMDPPALKKSLPSVYLDLSGIAKGYASDSVSELLKELGFANSMVEIGGEVRTRGRKKDKRPWRIGIEQPDERSRRVHAAVRLVDAGMATSGDYRNFFEYQGVRYSHTVDPTTGRPVTHNAASASIVAATAMEADALATAVLVMGDERGYDWCREQGLAAMLLVRDGDEIVERTTPEFEKLLKRKSHK